MKILQRTRVVVVAFFIFLSGFGWASAGTVGWTSGTSPSQAVSGAPANPRIENGKKIYELYYGANIPEWGIYNYGNGPDGFQGQAYYGSNQQLGDTTRGNYTTVMSFRQDTSIWGASYFDTGIMYYWDLKRVPKNLNITRAYIGLSGTDARTEGGNHPTGKEQVPIRAILNPKGYTQLWTKTYLVDTSAGTQESNWNGASWLYWKQEPNGGVDSSGRPTFDVIRWSDAPSTSPVPKSRVGDLSSVMAPLTSDTARISFNPDAKSMSYSGDVTSVVRGMVSGTVSNWGFVLDSYNSGATEYFADTSNTINPKYRVRVGVMPGNDVTPVAQRPRLIIEVADAGSTTTSTPTTPPVTSDITPPATPGSLQKTAVDGSTATLRWNSVSATDLSTYRLYRNGIKMADVGKVTSYIVTGLTAGTTYTFQISAVDVSGNESVKSGVLTVITAGTTPPVSNTGTQNGKKIYELYPGATIPEWGISNYNGFKTFSFLYGKNYKTPYIFSQNLSVIPLTAIRQGTWVYKGVTYTTQKVYNSGVQDSGSVVYWDLSSVPKSPRIKRAYFAFVSGDPQKSGGSFPNGQEEIAISYITDPNNYGMWTTGFADPRATSKIFGANFHYRVVTYKNGTVGTLPWSTKPSGIPAIMTLNTGQVMTGDLTSSVSSPITRMSFQANNTVSISGDVTSIVQQMIDGKIKNQGFLLDAYHNYSKVYRGDNSNQNPKWSVNVGLYSGTEKDATKRPRLIIEYDDGTVATTTPPTSDTTAPATPTGLRAATIGATSVTLAWGAVADVDVSTYRLYRGGTKIADAGKVTSYTVSSLTPSTSYTFQISAVDMSGNESAKSSVITVTTNQGTVYPNNYIIEKITRTATGHRMIYPDTSIVYPAKGGWFIDPTTGYRITRITEVTDGAFPDNPAAFKGHPATGLTNGYARYHDVNKSGKYAIAFMTTPGAVLYDISQKKLLGIIKTNDPVAVKSGTQGKIGERSGIRWDKIGGPGRDTLIYYFVGLKFYKQDALIGPSSETLIYDFSKWDTGAKYIHEESYGDFSDDMRYRALRLCMVSFCNDDPQSGTVKNVVFDMQTGQPLKGVVTDKWPKGNDISPDGKWLHLTGYNLFYRISDIAQGITNQPVSFPPIGASGSTVLGGGHGSWVYDYNDDAVFAWISNSDDWLHVFNPGTKEDRRIMHAIETGYLDYHIARGPKETKGWILIAAYGTSNPKTIGTGNQLLMVEMKPGVTGVHPNLTTVASANQPRMWRLGPTYNQRVVNGVDVGGYFAEGFASFDMDGSHIYWGGNWNATTNLELYQMELPTDWQKAF